MNLKSFLKQPVLCISLFLFCCGNNDNVAKQNKTQEKTINEVEIVKDTIPPKVTDPKEVLENTYIMEGKSIVFFMIAQEEFDSISTKLNDDYKVHDVNELMADFDSYANVTTPKIEKAGIKAESVRNRYFKISTSNGEILFDRKKSNKHYGVIMSDGVKEPLIVEGVILEEKDYRKMIKKYFEIDIGE